MCDSRDAYIKQSKTKVLDFFSKHKFLIYYKRNQHGQKLGVMVAFKDTNGIVYVGASKCNKSAGDKFNKYIGISKAIDGAISCNLEHKIYRAIPSSMVKDIPAMLSRINRYFKIGAVSESSVGR